MLNHAEKRISLVEISKTIERAQEVGLLSIVCSSAPEEAEEIAKLKPDIIISEPTNLIGTLKSVGIKKNLLFGP